MKNRFFGLLMVVVAVVPVSTVGAISRETIHNVSKYSLVGGLLGTLGFTGYMAYLNKAITNAQTPEEKAALTYKKHLLKKLNVLALLMAAGGGVGTFATSGEEKLGQADNPTNEVPNTTVSTATTLMSKSKPSLKKKKVDFADDFQLPEPLPLPRAYADVDAALPIDLQRLPFEDGRGPDISQEAKNDLIACVLGAGVPFNPQLFAQKQLKAITTLSTRELQERALCNAVWNASMMQGGGASTINHSDGNMIYNSYCYFAHDILHKNITFRESHPPQVELFPLSPEPSL